MEDFTKADYLDMLSELNEYAVMNDVKDVWIRNNTNIKAISFTHFNKSYKCGNETIYIFSQHNIDDVLVKYERMMKCMKEGALLVD